MLFFIDRRPQYCQDCGQMCDTYAEECTSCKSKKFRHPSDKYRNDIAFNLWSIVIAAIIFTLIHYAITRRDQSLKNLSHEAEVTNIDGIQITVGKEEPKPDDNGILEIKPEPEY